MKEKLNGFHIALLIYMIELDVTIFSIPRLVAENFGTNGWLGLLLLSGLAVFNIYLYNLVFRLGNGRSAFDIAESVVPKAVLYPLYVALALFWILLGSLVGKHFIFIFQMIAFQTTNPMLIYFLFAFMVYALLSKHIYGISKAATVFFFISFWMAGLSYYFVQDWRLIRFTPFFFQGADGQRTVYDLAECYTVFVGYELCLFLFPFVDRQSKFFRGVYIGHLLITCIQLLAVVVCSGFFSFDQIKAMQYPIISLLEYIELPFINRVENLVYTFFLFSNLVSTVMFCFAALMSLRRVFPRAKDKLLEVVISCLVFAFGYIPQIIRESISMLRFSYFIELVIAFAIPLLLLPMIWRLRHKGRMT